MAVFWMNDEQLEERIGCAESVEELIEFRDMLRDDADGRLPAHWEQQLQWAIADMKRQEAAVTLGENLFKAEQEAQRVARQAQIAADPLWGSF